MKNNISIPTEYAFVVERSEKNTETKAKHAYNPHSLPLTSICTLVHILRDTFSINMESFYE